VSLLALFVVVAALSTSMTGRTKSTSRDSLLTSELRSHSESAGSRGGGADTGGTDYQEKGQAQQRVEDRLYARTNGGDGDGDGDGREGAAGSGDSGSDGWRQSGGASGGGSRGGGDLAGTDTAASSSLISGSGSGGVGGETADQVAAAMAGSSLGGGGGAGYNHRPQHQDQQGGAGSAAAAHFDDDLEEDMRKGCAGLHCMLCTALCHCIVLHCTAPPPAWNRFRRRRAACHAAAPHTADSCQGRPR
jgi:hypothetical protein